MELTFYRTVEAHEVEPGDTLHAKRIVVDQIIRDMADGEGAYLFRGYAPGYKRRQAQRVKAGEPVQLALTGGQATTLEAAVDDLLETAELVAERFGCARTDWHPPADEVGGDPCGDLEPGAEEGWPALGAIAADIPGSVDG
jgi:hypothetical protein